MKSRLLSSDVTTMPLTRDSHAGIWTEGGWPSAAMESLARLGGVEVSVWESTAGVVADIENDELLLVLSGTGSLRFEDGEHVELRPGVAVRLHSGDRAEWTMTTTLRALTVSSR